jgi:hypothetical protein
VASAAVTMPSGGKDVGSRVWLNFIVERHDCECYLMGEVDVGSKQQVR